MIVPVILAGGSGSRLWPLSRTQYPKQFIPLVNKDSMLQNTLHRINELSNSSPIVICNNDHRFMVAEQLRDINITSASIILEPVSRNTAPAIALAALKAMEEGNDPLLLVLAADHVITNIEAFNKIVLSAQNAAEENMLITFGVIPTHAETGYGYIKQGKKLSSNLFEVDEFVEKPDIETANSYLTSGSFSWNSGIFLFKASTYLNELKKYSPKIFHCCCNAINSAYDDLDFIRISKDIFSDCPNDSIDYAVMEKTRKAAVIPMSVGWSDVGSWSALWDVQNKDSNGNVIRGDTLIENSTNSYIYAKNKLVAAIGVNDLIIVETKDAVLVVNKNHVQDVKNIVNILKQQNRTEYLRHLEIFRPWGKHEHIADGERYHVKKVIVRPGEKTATQIHYHRAEHWVVVSGTAKVKNGSSEYFITENESTYIPIGSPHSFENPGKIDLEIIEVRTGQYLSEDDIKRIGTEGEGY
ncbi:MULTISPECIES: mannose-1-phosphate guanylyltransferase/mannose-6-phosphate isomerase [Providencia]|uniref:mannose-1-phosphate guanylyltransferase/mannose-6-phosphate isomerase n=1 Tax=Providencia TaxID=586 RepID=UPI000807F64B|nr:MULTISPECIES: mannose-1-phosphate guanylyltransferase/mannose-6-phosphate isomerase [unclassified Providencia]ELR5287416.1 mannose-1-phosphate guanylyltransferase/mannose-6-phosphate isomerase [Providencia rettgeri]MDT5427677.1 mannose-1-phosphate guanylyltransferase/mannose-6-phosphate isomerase [Providencia rettgeri]OBY37018.1 mannose-1-phosphate guanylyltransferase/mannose-6-phosphate isomerase [Providencia rettgeri]QIF59718.1 mannose-1-phosphate guanylyltransferase/mannose-6-phosphate is